MGKYTTIKVSKKTLKMLHKLAGELAQKREERVTLEDAVLQILAEHKSNKKSNIKKSIEIEEDRKDFIALLEEKVKGAGPNDFVEYDFEDIGGKVVHE